MFDSKRCFENKRKYLFIFQEIKSKPTCFKFKKTVVNETKCDLKNAKRKFQKQGIYGASLKMK
jgi:hypothetical protein